MVANNPEQEEAEEIITVDYDSDQMEIGFNVSYLLDVTSVIKGENIKVSLADANSSALLEDNADGDSLLYSLQIPRKGKAQSNGARILNNDK